MFRRFLPKNETFYDFFENHVSFCVQAAEALLLFNDSQDPKSILGQIKQNELEGDKVTQRCIEGLHRTFITPFDRGEIHHLISKMDDVLDKIEDIATCVVIYKLISFSEEATQLIQIVVNSVQEVNHAVKELRKMKNTEKMRLHFSKINQLENEADHILTRGLAKLFETETDIRELIKWKEVYEHLEQTTDICEDVADLLEGIILENE